jgi:hypothetical protein
MSVTAYVQADPSGRLTADSTLTVEGATYPIPKRGWYGSDRSPSRAAPHRISAALDAAGYEPGYLDVSEPDASGRFEIQVVKA